MNNLSDHLCILADNDSDTGAPNDMTESIPTRPPVVWPLEGDTRWGAAPRLNVIDKTRNYIRNPKELANNEVYVCDGYIYVRAPNDGAWKGYALAAQLLTDSFTELEQRLRSENRNSELQHLRTRWKPRATTRPLAKRNHSPHLSADLDTRYKRSWTTSATSGAQISAPSPDSTTEQENDNLRARLQRSEASNMKFITTIEEIRKALSQLKEEQTERVDSMYKSRLLRTTLTRVTMAEAKPMWWIQRK